MKAQAGDMIVVPGRTVGSVQRQGRIVEVRGPDGQPPYLVRWEPDAHEALFVPTSGVNIRPASP